jgi:histidine triad (HIT) family protein
MDKNCIFCKIIGNEIPATTLYEDEYFKAIMDISPAAKGHAILISKKHVADIYEVDEETASRAFSVAAKIARAMKEELNCEGINILQNNGEAAGQTVFHLHIHIIPRYKGDTVDITWKQGSYAEGEVQAVSEAIRRRIK